MWCTPNYSVHTSESIYHPCLLRGSFLEKQDPTLSKRAYAYPMTIFDKILPRRRKFRAVPNILGHFRYKSFRRNVITPGTSSVTQGCIPSIHYKTNKHYEKRSWTTVAGINRLGSARRKKTRHGRQNTTKKDNNGSWQHTQQLQHKLLVRNPTDLIIAFLSSAFRRCSFLSSSSRAFSSSFALATSSSLCAWFFRACATWTCCQMQWQNGIKKNACNARRKKTILWQK